MLSTDSFAKRLTSCLRADYTREVTTFRLGASLLTIFLAAKRSGDLACQCLFGYPPVPGPIQSVAFPALTPKGRRRKRSIAGSSLFIVFMLIVLLSGVPPVAAGRRAPAATRDGTRVRDLALHPEEVRASGRR